MRGGKDILYHSSHVWTRSSRFTGTQPVDPMLTETTVVLLLTTDSLLKNVGKL